MNTLLLGNSIALLGCLIMVAVGFLQKKTHILLVQCVQCGLMGLSNLILGGISGFICNYISIVRNLVFVKYPITKTLKLTFISLQVLLNLSAILSGFINCLPTIAASLFTWNLDTKSEVRLKCVILITMILWLIYDFTHRNYVASAFDIMTMISNCIGLYMIYKKKQ